MSILTGLKGNGINLALICILFESIRDKKLQKHVASACNNVFLFRHTVTKQCF